MQLFGTVPVPWSRGSGVNVCLGNMVMPLLETPMGLALLVCDTTIQDSKTGKRTLVGLFHRLQSSRFPCVHPQMAVFVALTSGRGTYPCEVICKHADGKTVAFSIKGEVKLRDPSQVVEFAVQLAPVRFPLPGTYWLHFLADEVPIMMRPILVRELQENQKPSGDAD